MAVRDVLIVGAGPAGLATAIACRQLGLDYQVVEKGRSPTPSIGIPRT